MINCTDHAFKFVLAESNAINRYLARKAGLFGTSEDETALIDQFYDSWCEIIAKGFPIVRLKSSEPEKYTEQLKNYQETVVAPILTKHEEALQKNGTGYYVGGKVRTAGILQFV
jgi:glutathione S-transferase